MFVFDRWSLAFREAAVGFHSHRLVRRSLVLHRPQTSTMSESTEAGEFGCVDAQMEYNVAEKHF